MNRINTVIITIAFIVIMINSMAQKTGSFQDPRDGKLYNTIIIGTQIWMAENLNYATDSGSWCLYDQNLNCDKLGRLYNWQMANVSCPAGWHLPKTEEWKGLIDNLGGDTMAGATLKDKNGWNSSGSKATNNSGFSAIAGGYRNFGGVYGGSGTQGYWWSGAIFGSGAWYYSLRYDSVIINKYGSNHRKSGFSVRCIKD